MLLLFLNWFAFGIYLRAINNLACIFVFNKIKRFLSFSATTEIISAGLREK